MGEGEEKIGSYEFSENKIQLKGIRENMAAANFASFIEMANLKDHRLVCIAGMPYSGVGHLAKMVNKKFGHKIIPRGPVEEQRKHFEGQTGNFVIEHCAPEDLAKLFDQKGAVEDRNFVLFYINIPNVKVVGRLMRAVEAMKKGIKGDDKTSIEMRRKAREFLSQYGGLSDRPKYLTESDKLLKKFTDNYRVYVVKNSFK